MKTVYFVEHENIENDYIEEPRVIGIYTSEKLAQEAIERARNYPVLVIFPKVFKLRNTFWI